MTNQIRKIDLTEFNEQHVSMDPHEIALENSKAFDNVLQLASDSVDAYLKGDRVPAQEIFPFGFALPSDVIVSVKRKIMGIATVPDGPIEEVLTLGRGVEQIVPSFDGEFEANVFRVGIVLPEMLTMHFFEKFNFKPEVLDTVLQAVRPTDKAYEMIYVPLDDTVDVEFVPSTTD